MPAWACEVIAAASASAIRNFACFLMTVPFGRLRPPVACRHRWVQSYPGPHLRDVRDVTLTSHKDHALAPPSSRRHVLRVLIGGDPHVGCFERLRPPDQLAKRR